ncbi:WD domain, G-beta repeat [Posidoniimonas corsicana]|uniref:WD domain, G-beta repeat n=1 Tax=Posidoniimonas corsicana TaxID=1938618 RepID=A0A5C5VE67_9BACT|nr:c-type cytochrome domain-containing protein [Posidoniimonas corsicana]TWT36451.1 WD domain, G-beta repeat [Posidoniimonas corsicana]
MDCRPLAAVVRACIALLFFLFTGHGASGEPVTFLGEVRDVLRSHCVGCHNPNRSEADLDLSSFPAVMEGSYSGEVVVAGQPDESLLYLVTAHEDEPAMPPGGRMIPQEELEVLKSWISGGLLESPDSTPTPADAPVGAPASSPAAAPLVFLGERSDPVVALDASVDTGVVAVGGQLQVLLVDIDKWRLKEVLPYPEGVPQTLRFSRDGSLLLAGGGVHGQSGGVVMWDARSGERVATRSDEFDAVLAVDISPSNGSVAWGGPDRKVKVSPADTLVPTRRFEKHTDWVLDARFSPEGLLLASSDRAGGVYAVEAESGSTLHSLRGHNGAVTAVAWVDRGDTLATASEDGTVRQWNMHTGQQSARWTAHADGVLDLVATEAGLVTAGRDGRVIVWDADGKALHKSEPLPSMPTAIAPLGNDAIAVGCLDGSLWRWSVGSDQLVAFELANGETTTSLADLPQAGARPPELSSGDRAVPTTASLSVTDPTSLADAAALVQRVTSLQRDVSDLLASAESLRDQIAETEEAIARLESAMGDSEQTRELEQAATASRAEFESLGQRLVRLAAVQANMDDALRELAVEPACSDELLVHAATLQRVAREKIARALQEVSRKQQVARERRDACAEDLASSMQGPSPEQQRELDARRRELSGQQALLADLEARLQTLLRGAE